MELFNQKYGEISDINKQTIYYVQQQILGINRLLKSVHAPLKIVAEIDFSGDSFTEEQKQFFTDSTDIINYLSKTSDSSLQ